jgi:DNA-binding CsgD family transcriptional regulator
MKYRDFNQQGRELLIGEIYNSVLGRVPLANALRALADLTGSDKAFWGTFDPQQGKGELVDCHNVAPAFVRQYVSRQSSQNVWLQRAQYFQTEGLVWPGSKIWPMQDLMPTPFYRTFLAPLRIYHTLHIVVMIESQRITHVMLSRPEEESEFGQGEIELARLFALHARRAAECHGVITRLRMVQSGLSEVADDSALAVAILDPPAVLFMSEPCERILTSLGSPSPPAGAAAFGRAKEVYFPRAIADAINRHDHATTTRLILERADDSGRVIAVLKPFRFRGSPQAEDRVGLLLNFSDLTQKALVDEELLRLAYDLTASEARICSLLAKGDRIDQVSGRLNISPNTARTHVKRIFSKTGSTRQAELVMLILNSAVLRRTARKADFADVRTVIQTASPNADAIPTTR